MDKIYINVEKKTRMISLTKTKIGNDLENLQQELVFKFTDEFVNGSARLEYKIDSNRYHIPMTKDGESYTIPIKNIITKEGKIEMQLVIVQVAEDEEIPVFKSNVFFMYCDKSINAQEEPMDDYEYWLDVIEEKIAEMDEALTEVDNLDIDASKSGDTATISITNKEGTTKTVQVKDGIDGADAKINGVNALNIEAGTNISLDQQGSTLTINSTGGGGGGTSNYNNLTNKPSINNITLSGNKTLSDLGIQPAGNYALESDIPTKTSDLINDSDFITPSYHDNTKQDITDNTLTTANKTIPTAINEVNSIAKGANQAVGYNNYQTMITALNAMDDDEYNVGQNVYIVTVNVPDLWVSSVESTSSTYTYVDDATVVNDLETNGYIQVGYYKLSMLETQKADLTNYVTNTDYATSNTGGVVKISNGDYGLAVDEGVLKGAVRTLAQYNSMSSKGIVCKGTLENVISGKANKISVVQTSTSTIEINPNTFYKFGEVASLNITLASITDNTIYNEYMFEFVSGTTATTLTLPSSIKWLETPTIDANKIYQCSIVDNVGLLVGVANV